MKRYIDTFRWLITQHLRLCPWLFATFLATTIVGRIGAICGLIVGAQFMSRLVVSVEQSAVHTLQFGLEISNGAFKALLVVVPVAFILIAALCQRISARIFDRLIALMLPALANDYFQRLAHTYPRGLSFTARDLAMIYETILRIEFRFPTLIQNILILSVVILVSMVLLPPLIALTAIAALIVFIAAFLSFRHQHSHSLHERIRELDREKLDLLRAIDKLPMADDPDGAQRAQMRLALSTSLQRKYFWRWDFSELSRIAGLLAQAGMVGLLLLYVAARETIGPSDLAQLISVFLVMRFAISTVQNINITALSIAPDYRSLVRLKDGMPFQGKLPREIEEN